ncbi:tumor necrosis factor ligand superfamily member 13B-like isoform X1 [Brienomyrus brachyistius]|uniref:tumor necrosis factor ligand superfamily member 13B-like isoform X1 n=1 Tax=Brienomyrus brachyistius TaxID=42636 RepID=UPI0020B254CE|nr:tumor necrosis factor ligand superfamily member 13B-like isoform X1 [Brienomyrus brachyistius]
MAAALGNGSSRASPEAQHRRLSWAVLVLTLAAVTSSSLSVLSLYHILALKAEVIGLHAELSRRRGEQQSVSMQRLAGRPQEPQETHAGQKKTLDPVNGKLNSNHHHQTSQPDVHSIKKRSSEKVLQPCLQMMTNSNREPTLQGEACCGWSLLWVEPAVGGACSHGVRLSEEHTVLPWLTGLRRGTALEEKEDAILVKEEGFYFVYSQVFYMDTTFAMGHFIVRKKQNVVGDELKKVILFRCVQNMDPDFPYNTCYTGGIVKLEVGDRVELLIPRKSANVSLDGDSTFLGAIKLV